MENLGKIDTKGTSLEHMFVTELNILSQPPVRSWKDVLRASFCEHIAEKLDRHAYFSRDVVDNEEYDGMLVNQTIIAHSIWTWKLSTC